MKLPKTFTHKKGLKDIESLLKGYNHSPLATTHLLDISEQFSEKGEFSYGKRYLKGVELTKNLKYTLKDVEELTKNIGLIRQDPYFGVFLSVLINKVITKEDKIVLTLDGKLNGLGMCLQKGTVVIEGDLHDNTGAYMEGGKLIVKGNTNNLTGHSMKGGELIIKGNTNDWTGNFMEGGKVTVEGNAGSYTGSYMRLGEITIGGDTGDAIGNCMRGGKITVKGNILSAISIQFKGGTIIHGTKVIRNRIYRR